MRMWAMTEDGRSDSQVLVGTALCDSCFTSENRAKAADERGRSKAPYEFTICSRKHEYTCINCGRQRRADLKVDGGEVGPEHACGSKCSAEHAGSTVGYW